MSTPMSLTTTSLTTTSSTATVRTVPTTVAIPLSKSTVWLVTATLLALAVYYLGLA